MPVRAFWLILPFSCYFTAALGAEPKPAVDFGRDVAPILQKYCVSCHSAEQAKSDLDLSAFSAVMEGGKRGPSVVAGQSGESRLTLTLEGKSKPAMPPKGKPAPSAAEVAVLKRWIDAGAKPPSQSRPAEPTIPVIKPLVEPRRSITAVAFSPDGKSAAVAGYRSVTLLDPHSGAILRRIDGLPGQVTSVRFSSDGKLLVVAGGEPGRFGEARLYNAGDLALVRAIRGHDDSLYAAELSHDGKLLATAGYDKLIRIWDAATGKMLKTLKGHNDAVFALAFRADDKVLASASGDRTVKLWNVITGARLDTFSQATKEQYGVVFNPRGDRAAAVGADNRIRVWSISSAAAEGSNPIQAARFAHQAPIIKIVCSADGKLLATAAEDRTVKLWDFATVTERRLLETQTDWAAALDLSPDGKWLLVGRHDGSLTLYAAAEGKKVRDISLLETKLAAKPDKDVVRVAAKASDAGDSKARPTAAKSSANNTNASAKNTKASANPAPAPAKPEASALWPRGIQIGAATRIRVSGKHLLKVDRMIAGDPRIKGKVLNEPKATDTAVWLEVSTTADLPRGAFELGVAANRSESDRLSAQADDIVQLVEQEPNDTPSTATNGPAPCGYWGQLTTPGDVDCFAVDGKKGQTLVVELSAKAIGSALNGVITVVDPAGRVVASANDFDRETDPLLAYTAPANGRYVVRVTDLKFEGSPNHFYRLSVGSFAYVTGVFPLAVPANTDTQVELAGINLPADAKAAVKAPATGEVPLSLDARRYRWRRLPKLIVGSAHDVVETEPNDTPSRATGLRAPGVANGRISAADPARPDTDHFKFRAKQGERWVIETSADRLGSPVDTRIDVLDANGRPVERVLLQAVRDSVVEFRGISSTASDVRCSNWLEMELNELMYLDGEVCKLFRMPQGPDSGFTFYPARGGRRTYFDTSPTAHAVGDACYVVQPHPPGARLIANGLPSFVLHYANDDSADRKIGKDSRLTFVAPADGNYVVRVADSRSLGGARYGYRLTIRKPHPDFKVSLNGANPTVPAGSGREIGFSVERIDGFEGEVKIDVSGLPQGFTLSAPIVIQRGHASAQAVLRAAADAKTAPSSSTAVKIVAKAMMDEKEVVRPVSDLGTISLTGKPKVSLTLEPAEVALAPGGTAVCTLKIVRNGADGPIRFQPENLPHGVIVDNIGLSGILIPAGQNQRQMFLAARKWVPTASRPFFLVSQTEGGQASNPVIVHVRPQNQVAGAQPER